MVLSCVACGRNAKRDPGVSFHNFPKSERLKSMWLTNLNLSTQSFRSWHRICSYHFNPNDYETGESKLRFLKKNVVPSSNLPLLYVPLDSIKTEPMDNNSKNLIPEIEVKEIVIGSSAKESIILKTPINDSRNSTGNLNDHSEEMLLHKLNTLRHKSPSKVLKKTSDEIFCKYLVNLMSELPPGKKRKLQGSFVAAVISELDLNN